MSKKVVIPERVGSVDSDYKRYVRKQNRQQRLNDRKIRNSTKRETGSFGIFKLFIVVLVIISFSYFIRNGSTINFSFQSLLNRLADCPDVSLSFAQFDMTIYGDWGPFDVIRGFLNMFAESFEIMITFTGFLFQMFVVLFYLLGLLFI